MCTVTFLPLSDNGFVLTSNRDVGYQREKALAPKTYIEDGVSLHYPKDGKAGGTWIGTSRNNRLICLLNGGFENHIQQKSYAKSRGLIVKELLITEDFEEGCLELNLKGIEPFTLVVVDWKEENKLFEFVWDGNQRFFKELEWQPMIWSSSTLYTDKMKALRQAWFREWFIGKGMSPENSLDFHKNAGLGFPEVDVFMRRERVGTVSITQIIRKDMNCDMTYFPYGLNQKSEE
jgi:hypothetical protein